MKSGNNLSQFYYKNNRLQQVRGFCNTVTYNAISKAAEIMGLTQSSISLQIKSLERDLGIKLIKRNNKNSKKFELTKDGKIFYKIAIEVINNVDDLFDTFLLEKFKYHDSYLKIAGHHSVFSILLPNALKKIKTLVPDLKLNLLYLTKEDAFQKLEQEEIDVAIYPVEDKNLVQKNLTYHKISNYNPALITPLNHPLSKISNNKITFEEIGKYNYLHTGNYAISDIMKYNIASKVLKGDIELDCGSWEILKSLVAAGLGVTIFHQDYCKNSKDVVIKNVKHLSPNIAYYAIFKDGIKPKKLIQNLINLVKMN